MSKISFPQTSYTLTHLSPSSEPPRTRRIETQHLTIMLSQLTLITILTALTSASPLVKRAPAFKLHPAGDQTLCLGVPTGTTPGDGTPLYNIPCASAATGFEIAKGDNQVVRLTGTNFCLDAGSSKSMRSGVGMPYMQSSHSGILGCRPDGRGTCQALDLLPRKPIIIYASGDPSGCFLLIINSLISAGTRQSTLVLYR